MLVEFVHSYDVFDCFYSYGSPLELQLFLCSAVQTGHILLAIWVARENCRNI